ncbi:hypothetical protein ASF61_05985 [Duganella sp. Leaf126]|nr:hypothetical protein ASF61_05985 [Duganella sp. Leaf126]
MQALKKAERAKQNATGDVEVDRPSREFDELLALTPDPAPAPAPGNAGGFGGAGSMAGGGAYPVAAGAAGTDARYGAAGADAANGAGVGNGAGGAGPGVTDRGSAGGSAGLGHAAAKAGAAGDPAGGGRAGEEGGAAGKSALSLDFAPAFSLEPPTSPTIAAAASVAARPMPDPAPASPIHDAGTGFTLAPDPSAPDGPGMRSAPAGAGPASFPPAAAAAPYGSNAAQGATAGAADFGPDFASGAGRGVGRGAGATIASDVALDAITGEPLHARTANPAAAAGPRPAPGASRNQTSHAGNDAAPTPRRRARQAASAGAEPPGMDPERLRLIGLLTVLVLIIVGFAYYYWQAVMAPGAGARLPPVAMPPAGATGATGSGAVQIVGPADTGNSADGAAESADPSVAGMLAPSPTGGMNRAARDDLERRLERTEQELAATRQAIQAQAAAPRQDRLPPVAAPDNTDIRVARTVQPARIAPALENAYQALGSGDLVNAQQQYEAALRQDPNSRDALLGMAAVASRQNQGAQASAYYLRLLELDPNDATAVAGLVELRGGDAGQNERRLKAILTGNPDAGPVLFALGNLYAQQGRWPEAQQTYFRAYTAAPDNADYAYNLAIGLDRLNQGRLALTYYQRALALGQDKPVAFDRSALRQRMHELNGAH